MEEANEWRQRSVTEIVLRERDYVDLTTAYQICLPLELIRKYASKARIGDTIRLRLPFSVRPKQLLLDTDFTGYRNNSTSLLLRDEIATIQAEQLLKKNELPLDNDSLIYITLVGVSRYMVPGWRQYNSPRGFLKWPIALYRRTKFGKKKHMSKAIAKYLDDELNDVKVEPNHVNDWLELLKPAASKLIEALGEGEHTDSSADCVLLAIPFMEKSPTGLKAIDEVVETYSRFVNSLDQESLRLLANYGRRWQAIVETVVPIGVPCTIRMSERRPWPGSIRHRMVQEIQFGNAKSTHIEIRVASDAVMISKPRVLDFANKTVGYFDELRDTPHAAAIYTSDPRCPDFARVRVNARASYIYQLLVFGLFYPLVTFAIIAAVSLPGSSHFVNSLTLLVLPITLVGAFVISREPTSLAERLLLPLRFLMASSVVALWTIAIVRLARYTPVL